MTVSMRYDPQPALWKRCLVVLLTTFVFTVAVVACLVEVGHSREPSDDPPTRQQVFEIVAANLSAVEVFFGAVRLNNAYQEMPLPPPLVITAPAEVNPWPDIPGTPTDAQWDRMAQCESNGRWNINTGNGFYGGLQFTLTSWRAVGGTGYPNNASRAEQIYRADKLWLIQGWGAWPACSRKLGYRR